MKGTTKEKNNKPTKEELIQLRKQFDLFEKEKGRTSLQGFTAYTKEDYTFVWFHKLICYYLDKLERGEIRKLMIFLPPQHGKSELSSRRFPAYCLGRNPKLKIALASYGADLSQGFSRDVQSIIDTPRYRELFPDTKLNVVGVDEAKGERKTDSFFETVGHKGFVKAVGVKGSLTGSRVDIGIIDDPFKDRQEATSKTIRDRVWMWYQDVFLLRLHNNSRQLMLFTRWHEDDLAGRILDPNNEYYDEEEAKEWTVIALPAIKESTKPIPQAIDVRDPREIGEALWEEMHGRTKYERMSRINPTGYNSLAQQRPTAEEGNKLKRDWFEIKDERELPFSLNSITPDYFIDGAFTEKTKNDETGLGAFYFNKADGKLYVLNNIGIRKELYELLSFFKTFVLQSYYKPRSSVFIELKASGYPLKSMLSKIEYGAFNTRAVDSKIEALGKYNRVEASVPFLASGRVVLVKGAWNKKFIEQCVSFPNGKHDDQLDVLTYAIIYYFLKNKVGGVTYA